MAKATFAAGCFWGVEAAFRKVEGVTSTSVGYIGGAVDKPTYEQVCTGQTGHAEAVQVEFDPEVVSYDKLMEVFWGNHDPTQMNRQGPDVGTQYRSGIFIHDADQEAAARASKEAEQLHGRHRDDVVTEITPAPEYWLADDYHQQYFEKSGRKRLGLF